MSIEFSSRKEKRSRSSSSEANNSSFVKNVTSRVSGLLPATITKWFSSPRSSNTNGSAPTAEITDSSTEDEATESPVIAPPPNKRMRYTTPGNYNQYPPESNCIPVIVGSHDYASVQSPPGRNTFRRDTNYVSTPLRPSSDESVADGTDITDMTDKDMAYFRAHQHTMSSTGPSVAPKRKSLFDPENNQEASIRACAKTSRNTMRDPKQPCFKPSLLGSPFYPGMTMYGGASSSYINRPNIKQRKTALVNQCNTADNTMSTSARRIMDLLEHYSSPLNEARRIPPYTRTSRSSSLSSSFNSSIESAPPTNKSISYKTQELYVPSIASIMRLRQRSRLMDTTTAARQIIASHSSTANYTPGPTDTAQRKPTESKSTNKIKSYISLKKSRASKSAVTAAQQEFIMPTPVDLPPAVLQIDNNLPKFSLSVTPISHLMTTSTPKPVTSTVTSQTEGTTRTTTAELPKSKAEPVSSQWNSFKFSSPVKISSERPQSVSTNFKFVSPERSIDKPLGQVNEKKDDDISSFVGASKEPVIKIALKTKDWQCADCWVYNKPDVDKCVCCGGAKPSPVTAKPSPVSEKPAKCSVCKLANSQPNVDKCALCEKTEVNNISKPPAMTQAESSNWKCDDCWINNKESDDKCVCCGASNPKKASATAKMNAVSNDTGEWKCEDCWIKNKSSVDKCAACGGTRPGAKPASAPPPDTGFFNTPITKPDNSFKIFLKKQPEKWECPACLVRNDNDKIKCICCETEKPGTIKEADKKSFNFGMNTNTTFKFGIDPKAQEASVSNTEKTVTESKKGEESEKNNNSLSTTPSFTFGLPAKKSEDQTDTAKKTEEKVESEPKIKFSFGIPTTTSSAPAATSIFGVPSKVIEPAPKAREDEEEKPQEVPKIDFKIPTTQDSAKTSVITSPIALPQSSQEKSFMTITPVSLEKPATSTSLLNSSFGGEKKDSFSLPTPATTAATMPQFSCGIPSGIKPLTANTPVNKNESLLFGTPLQSAPSNTTTIFQKNEPVATTSGMTFPKSDSPSGVSLFQKSETPASTAAPPALGATAPDFNFGGAIETKQPEKPKFNFTFGANNNLEAQPFFKPTFGTGTENKFTLPTGTTISTINSISSNALGGNAISSSNSLGGNGLGTTPLGGNSLSTNPMSAANDISNNPLSSGNALQNSNVLQAPSGGIFGTPIQKENMWSTPSNTTTNMFASNTTNNIQKPAFNFGTSTPFNGPTPAFGNNNTQPTQNVFGIGNQNQNSQPSLFSTPATAPGASMFGNPQPTAAPAQGIGMFGTPSINATPAFGTPNPVPTFNFGVQPSSGVFGFGQQQQQQQQPQQAGIYSFGGAQASPAGGAPQVQFSMGSAPNTSIRRMRKAVRRNPPR